MTARREASAPAGVLLMTCEYSPFPGGIATYADRLVSEVRGAGFRARVIAPRYESSADPAHADDLRLLGHHAIGPMGLGRTLTQIAGVPPGWPVLAADIRSVMALGLLQPLHRRPFGAMIHGSEVSKLAKGGVAERLARHAYASASFICANSRSTADEFLSALPEAAVPRITYLGVDPHWFQAASGPFEAEGLRSLPESATLVSAVGRLEPRKGQIELIEAIASTPRREEVVLVMPGRAEDMAYRQRLLDRALALGVRLSLPGAVSSEDLKRLYARSACHVLAARDLPGRREGFGLVLLEAAAQGCPSVATRAGGVPEVMGDTGVLVDQTDAAALAAAVFDYVDDPLLRDRDGRMARARAQGFTWRDCARKTFPTLNWPTD